MDSWSRGWHAHTQPRPGKVRALLELGSPLRLTALVFPQAPSACVAIEQDDEGEATFGSLRGPSPLGHPHVNPVRRARPSHRAPRAQLPARSAILLQATTLMRRKARAAEKERELVHNLPEYPEEDEE